MTPTSWRTSNENEDDDGNWDWDFVYFLHFFYIKQ